MDTLERYSELMKRTWNEKPKEIQVNGADLDPYALNLVDKAKKNEYLVHSFYGVNPRVFIWGIDYSLSNHDQEERLADIFGAAMKTGDVLLYEGNDPSELDMFTKNYGGLVGRLQPFFVENGIRVLNNDDIRLRNKEYLNDRNRIALRKSPDFKVDEEYLDSIRELFDLSRKKAGIICHNPFSGIVPIHERENVGSGTFREDAMIHQVLNLFDLQAGYVPDSLLDSGVPYLTFVPAKVTPIEGL